MFMRASRIDHPVHGEIELLHRFGQVRVIHVETDQGWQCLTGAQAAFFIKGIMPVSPEER